VTKNTPAGLHPSRRSRCLSGAVVRSADTSLVVVGGNCRPAPRHQQHYIAAVPASRRRAAALADNDRPRQPLEARSAARTGLTWAEGGLRRGLLRERRQSGSSLRLAPYSYSTWRAYWTTRRDRHSPWWLAAELRVLS